MIVDAISFLRAKDLELRNMVKLQRAHEGCLGTGIDEGRGKLR